MGAAARSAHDQAVVGRNVNPLAVNAAPTHDRPIPGISLAVQAEVPAGGLGERVLFAEGTRVEKSLDPLPGG